ncbi:MULTISPECIES: class I SAM-dependent methyltransferase [unclassified Streptomyces]|uniref:class I SAM-dependent methyltransferase n=1 Tax=unclassified Streptomyces TaxID=2593676 RepID=UPI0037F4DBA7
MAHAPHDHRPPHAGAHSGAHAEPHPHPRPGTHGDPHHATAAETGAATADHEHADRDHADHEHADLLDLDATVLADHISAVTAWLPLTAAPRHIVDLGCGTGTGTFALLDRFPEAHVTAVDSSASHLQRLREKACAQGVVGRVRTVQADLDATVWPDLGTPDLVWASASMHHLAAPDRALRTVRDLLAPGGLFAVVELAGFPRFLPPGDPDGLDALEERCHAALDGVHAEQVPHRGADWGPMLTGAGFALAGERAFTVRVEGSGDGAVGAYALGGLRRMRGGVADVLGAADLAALDRLLDDDGPGSLLRRDDLVVRTERTVWAARPSG